MIHNELHSVDKNEQNADELERIGDKPQRQRGITYCAHLSSGYDVDSDGNVWCNKCQPPLCVSDFAEKCSDHATGEVQ